MGITRPGAWLAGSSAARNEATFIMSRSTAVAILNTSSPQSEFHDAQHLLHAVDAAGLFQVERHFVNLEWRLGLRVHRNLANADVLKGLVLVEGQRLFFRRGLRVREGKAKRAGGMQVRMANGVVVVAMDVTVEHRGVFERREQVHHLVTVGGEPLPLWLEIEERPVREQHDGRSV